MIAAYAATAAVFVVIDLIWLGYVVNAFYRARIGNLLLDAPAMPPAVAFYAIYVAGILYFAVAPALAAGSYKLVLVNGLLFGFFAYATYDLTNMATLKGWSWQVAIADIAWGSVLTAIAAAAGLWAAQAVR